MYIFDCAEPHKLSILTAADDSRNLKKGVKYWLKIKHHTISVFNCRKFEICYFPQGLVLRNVAMVLENFKETLSRAIRSITYFSLFTQGWPLRHFVNGFLRKSYTYIVQGFHFQTQHFFSIPCRGEKGPPLAGMFFYHFSETFKIILYLQLLKMY